MDCLQAREIVSEAFDRGVAVTPGVEEARAHCRGCAECRAFVEGLVALQKAPHPSAPSGLVEDVLERARMMFAADAEEAAAREAAGLAPAEPAFGTTPEAGAGITQDGRVSDSGSRPDGSVTSVIAKAPAPEGRRSGPGADPGTRLQAPLAWEPDIAARKPLKPRPRYWWVPRVSAVAAAAAVVVVAVLVAAQGLHRPDSARMTAATDDQALAPAAPPPPVVDGAATNGAGSLTDSAATGEAASKAALPSGTVRYVSYNGQAYTSLGQRTPDRDSVVAAGTFMSSFDTTLPATTRQVWQSKADPKVIFVDQSDGTWLAFSLVTRTLGGKTFVLSAEDDIGSFGVWPTLPKRFAVPTAPDGSPTFVEAGKDDTGLTVFAPPGAAADQGFALAPGAASSDPSAGNPNWTWWILAR